LSLEEVRKSEESLSEEYKSKRDMAHKNYAKRLKKLTPEERLKTQKRTTLRHLNEAGIYVNDFKKMLQEAGFYKGSIDHIFDEELAQSISDFQKENKVEPIDGTAGPKTLSKLSEVIRDLEKSIEPDFSPKFV